MSDVSEVRPVIAAAAAVAPDAPRPLLLPAHTHAHANKYIYLYLYIILRIKYIYMHNSILHTHSAPCSPRETHEPTERHRDDSDLSRDSERLG